jgi:hypothetical protein
MSRYLLALALVATPIGTGARGGQDAAQPSAVTDAPPAAAVALFPEEAAPSEATLGGLTVYPTADFLTSYDAGGGQRFYLFGCTASFEALVSYYQTLLQTRGSRVYDAPPTHIFEVGRYDEDSMSFPPSITVKDYTWGGMEGFLNPRPGGSPERYPSIIQVVPDPRMSNDD